MQSHTLDDGRKFNEFFGQLKTETPEQFMERMAAKAQTKLRNPEVNNFYQIRVGRNALCPCGSGLKFKKCCLGKINQGESEVALKA